MNIQELITKAIEISPEDFYTIETNLFIELNSITDKPDFIITFLGLSSWMGTSQRSGVWTYYEATDSNLIDTTIQYIIQNKLDEELCNMYILGNHDYGNGKYQDNYDYPQEWIDESEQIDQWITENEKKIILICQDILKTNLDFFCN